MQLDRKAIKARAREVLKENYWLVVGSIVLAGAISIICSFIPAVGYIASLIVVPVVFIGLNNMMVKMFRGEACTLEDMFASFKNFGHNLGGYWWEYLWTFLWALLFIIPGIYKMYAYFMTKYILMDHPDIDPQEALKVSMEITNGHKWEIFVMQLSFLGWQLLSAMTFGILTIFYVAPYMELTAAGYYVVLSEEFFERMGFYDSLSVVAPVEEPTYDNNAVDNSTVFGDNDADQTAYESDNSTFTEVYVDSEEVVSGDPTEVETETVTQQEVAPEETTTEFGFDTPVETVDTFVEDTVTSELKDLYSSDIDIINTDNSDTESEE